jgi:hypothetical protein
MTMPKPELQSLCRALAYGSESDFQNYHPHLHVLATDRRQIRRRTQTGLKLQSRRNTLILKTKPDLVIQVDIVCVNGASKC